MGGPVLSLMQRPDVPSMFSQEDYAVFTLPLVIRERSTLRFHRVCIVLFNDLVVSFSHDIRQRGISQQAVSLAAQAGKQDQADMMGEGDRMRAVSSIDLWLPLLKSIDAKHILISSTFALSALMVDRVIGSMLPVMVSRAVVTLRPMSHRRTGLVCR